MDARKIVVVVEDEDAARTALQWALHNLLRYGDLITLLHVFPNSSRSARTRSNNKTRLLRLQGFQLALSFKDICNRNFFNTNVEMIVTGGDQNEQDYGCRIATAVRQIGGSAVVVGLHSHSFLYRLAMEHENMATIFNCRVVAIRESPASSTSLLFHSHSTNPNMDFSQIDISGLHLQIPDMSPPKIPYRICPDPCAIIWKSRKTKRKERS